MACRCTIRAGTVCTVSILWSDLNICQCHGPPGFSAHNRCARKSGVRPKLNVLPMNFVEYSTFLLAFGFRYSPIQIIPLMVLSVIVLKQLHLSCLRIIPIESRCTTATLSYVVALDRILASRGGLNIQYIWFPESYREFAFSLPPV